MEIIQCKWVVLYGNIKDCPGFELSAQMKEARKSSDYRVRRWRTGQYRLALSANIEMTARFPAWLSQLIKICGLPVERYFNPRSCGGKRTAAAGQPQAETLPGRISADHRGRD